MLDGDVDWMNITTDDPSKVNEMIEAGRAMCVIDTESGSHIIWKFIEDVYKIFKTHLRPADDCEGIYQFARFTFLVVDS